MEKFPEPQQNDVEQNNEYVPTKGEIKNLFGEVVGGEYEEIRLKEDELGLYLWEIKIPGLEGEGWEEYSYMRKGQYTEGKALKTAIYKTIFEDGFPVGGGLVAEYREDGWVIIP